MPPTLDLSELDQRIGCLFMAGMPDLYLDEGTCGLIRDRGLGGVILFRRNVRDPLQVAELCRALQECSMEHQGFPLFLAVDQEGGRVARLPAPFTVFPGNRTIATSSQPKERAAEFARVTAHEMQLVGLNMNLAPVVDVDRGRSEVLQERTFGESPTRVAALGAIVIRTLQSEGILAVAKHFPGLGATGPDPHECLPVIELQAAELRAVDLEPFRAAITAQVAGIMTSHAVYPSLARDVPGTLSVEILTDLLRANLGFEGLILTDDLEMGAIAEHPGVVAGAAAAFRAGADLLLICHDQERVRESMDRVRQDVLTGRTPARRLLESNTRIVAVKSRLKGRIPPVSLAAVQNYFSA